MSLLLGHFEEAVMTIALAFNHVVRGDSSTLTIITITIVTVNRPPRKSLYKYNCHHPDGTSAQIRPQRSKLKMEIKLFTLYRRV